MTFYECQSNCDPQLFRAYDIRGMVDNSFTPDTVYTIARAIGAEALARAQQRVVIARDGRLSGPALLKALAAGLLDAGVDVIDLGMVPTPVLYYATHFLKTHSGVMLTGSHNPANYNGLKMVLGGQTLAESAVQALRDRILQGNLCSGQGAYIEDSSTVAAYQNEVVSQCHMDTPLHVVMDCGNGVTGAFAPALFRALGAKVTELYTEVDGHFPNHHPDPTRPENVKELIDVVRELKADVGFGFDGDGDRLGVVTNEGEIIWADRQMMWFASDILTRHPGAPIIYDVKCTQHLSQVIQAQGGKPLMWKTGHSLIKLKMKEMGAPFAGEMSGHLFFKDGWYGFDDAMYTGARLLKLLSQSDESLAQIFSQFPNSVNTPELMLSVPEDRKFTLVDELADHAQFPDAEVVTIDGLRVHFDHGWGLVRASNTTPCLVFRFEGDTEDGLRQIQERFRSLIRSVDPSLICPF